MSFDTIDPERMECLAKILPYVIYAVMSSYAVETHAIALQFCFVRMHVAPSCTNSLVIASVQQEQRCVRRTARIRF